MRTATMLLSVVVSLLGLDAHASNRCLKEIVLAGEAVYGPFVSIPDPQVVENFAISGAVQFVFLDGEHSAAIDPKSTLVAAMAGDAHGLATAIRVPSNEFDLVKRYVGTGVQAVIVPSIRTADDAKRAVDATKYPPLGRRAAGVERSNGYFDALAKSLHEANDRMLTVVMIETADAVRNIESIVHVPGIDVVHVGPFDLSLDMGVEMGSKAHTEAIRTVEAAAKKAGIALGGHAKDKLTAQAMRRRGYRFFTIPGDMTLLQEGPRAFLAGPRPSPTAELTARWLGVSRSGALRYLQQGYRPERKTFVSEIDGDGRATSEKVHTVALSRALHAYATDPTFLQGGEAWRQPLAEEMANYLMHKLARSDDEGPYFLTGTDGNDAPLSEPDTLEVAPQAYGLCGLVAYVRAFRHTGRVSPPANVPEVERFLVGAARAFFRRFESQDGAFWDRWDRVSRKPVRTKSFDSTIYPAVAFLMELPEAIRGTDLALARESKERLDRLGQFVAAHMMPADAPFIVEEFDEHGNPFWRKWKRGEQTMTLVGHNFQAALFLLQMAERVSSAETRSFYRLKAQRILTTILVGGGYDREFGGVFDVLVRETGERAYHDRKAWWQNAEALLALELARATQLSLPPIADEARRSIESFFLDQFVDPQGNEWDVVLRDGSRYAEAVQGNAGKSLFHTARLVHLLNRYRSPRIVFEGGHP